MSTTPTTASSSPIALWRRITPFHKVKMVFLLAALFSFALSVTLWFFVDREMGLFVGLWVPSLLALGALVLVGEDDAP